MSGSKNICNPCCCMYCRAEFVVKGKQRWHKCDAAMVVKRIEQNEKCKAWKKLTHYRQPDRRFGSIHVGKDKWKKCKRCGALTPNRFDHCSNCLATLEGLYDLDMMIAFEAGHDRRAGVRS